MRMLGCFSLSCVALSAQQSWAQRSTARRSIRQVARAKGRLYGAALAAEYLDQPEYAAIVARDCNIAVAENVFKWGWVESQQGNFNFELSDKVVSFCQQHNIALRGHCLLWHSSIPDWLPRDAFPPLELIEPWMRAIMQRYPNVVAWDVVNEVIDDQDNGKTYNLRLNATPEYLRDIYRLAKRLSNGKSELVYNDYGTEGSSSWNLKRQKYIVDLLKYLVDQDTGISGFGIQSHLRTNISEVDLDSMRLFIRAIRRLGLRVYATELDFLIPFEMVPRDVDRVDRIIADAYQRYLDMLFSEGVDVVLTWGITDKSTWLRSPEYNPYNGHPELFPFIRPLLYDEQYQPKAAYDAVLQSFSETPAAKQLS